MDIDMMIRYLTNPDYRFRVHASLGLLNCMPDKTYLQKMFQIQLGYKLDLEHPQTFNEKLQWLKLHHRDKKMSLMVDKFEAKKWVAPIIGQEHVIKTLGVWDHFDEIDFDRLPDQFVLKCTHDSGGLIICRDKRQLNIRSAREKIKKACKRNYYWLGREWPYKDVQPRIIAERYMQNDDSGELEDYKIFCFHGEPVYIQLDYDRFTDHKRQFYSTSWELLPIKLIYDKKDDRVFEKPSCLQQMLQYARLLSADEVFLRTDFYQVNGKVYFGEMTFYPESGFGRFISREDDVALGKLMNLHVLENDI